MGAWANSQLGRFVILRSPYFDLKLRWMYWDLDAWAATELNMAPWSADLPVLARGESVTYGLCNCFIYDRMAQRPAVLENLIFELLGVLDVEGGLKPSKPGLTSDCFFNFLEDFQAILYHEPYSLLTQIIHLLSADPEEGLPVEFAETLSARALFRRRIPPPQPPSDPKTLPAKGGCCGSRQNSSAFPDRSGSWIPQPYL